MQTCYIVTSLFIMMDLITGLLKSLKKREFNSSVMRQGLWHKSGCVLAVCFGVLVDYAQSIIDLGLTMPVALTVCVYICLMEMGSIFENICVINPQLATEKSKQYFEKLKERE